MIIKIITRKPNTVNLFIYPAGNLYYWKFAVRKYVIFLDKPVSLCYLQVATREWLRIL